MGDNNDELVNWEAEANAIIKDIEQHVKEVKISQKLPSNELKIYLNLTTNENEIMCIRVSRQGFMVVADDYDKDDYQDRDDNEDNPVYETSYALLSSKSKLYIQSFGLKLADALNLLAQASEQNKEMDQDSRTVLDMD